MRLVSANQLIRALVLSGPSGACGWSLGSLLNLLSPECCPKPKAIIPIMVGMVMDV